MINDLTKDEILEAAKVPVIMGRGRAYAIVIGENRFAGFISKLCRAEPDVAGRVITHVIGAAIVPKTGRESTLFGLKLIVTANQPNTCFAVTESEYGTVLRLLQWK